MITEEILEQQCIEWFRELGYLFASGYDIACDGTNPERDDYHQIVLKGRFIEALKRINPDVPVSSLEEVVHIVSTPKHPVLIYSNREFHRMVVRGVNVSYKKGDETVHDVVSLIDFGDFKNNDFLVVNQFSVKGEKHTRRSDLVVFINGLPLSVIELKNPADESTDIWDAFNQLQTYKEDVSDLFVFNGSLVISDGVNARLGSLSADKERFMRWRVVNNEDDRPKIEYEIETLIKGFFNPELFLDYIRYFVLFEENDGRLVKKIAAYHQFHAVREAVRVTILASADDGEMMVSEPRANYGNEVVRGSRKAGVVWHTQGSGKSITMCCYAGKLMQQPEMKNPTIVVVTDRNDLDGQLFQTFCGAGELFKDTPVQAESRESLRDMLLSRQSGGIIFTTVQKFSLLDGEDVHPLLDGRSNIVVISDEAHRSQYGLKAKLDTKTGDYKFGYAKHMRDALPNASFIGFTGTPISFEDKNTRAVFGDYLSIYDIQDAVEDGATVPIFYESRLAKLKINSDEIEKLNKDVEELVEDEEDVAAREKTKSVWSTLEKLVGSLPRLRQIAEDIVCHYEKRVQTMPGKAMIVCMSRDICVNLYNEIISLKPEWHSADPEKGIVKIIMTGSASDRENLRPHIYPKLTKKWIEKRFKDPADELKIVIVRDMWLTGFDVPSCHTMYVDKPMKGHSLMQAIARVNRVFKDKQGGLVVDYIGIGNELKNALKLYTDSKGKGEPTRQIDEAFAILIEKLDALRGMFSGFDYSKFEKEAHRLLIPAANHILGLDDGKKRFLDLVTALTKAFSLCGTLDETVPLKKEIAFFSAIKAVILKYTSVDRKRSEEYRNSLLKQILDNAVVAEGVADIFELAGLEKPNIGLLSEDFLEDVRRLPEKNLAVALLEKLLKDEIKSRVRGNVVQEKKYGDRLLDTLNRYHNRAIETAQVIEELILMVKDFKDAMKREEKLGLNPEEIRFYDALAENESAVRELGDEILKKIAVELTENLRKNATVDWYKRESVRAKLRILVRRLLKKYKYPPDKQEDAVELVLRQAETMAEDWGGE